MTKVRLPGIAAQHVDRRTHGIRIGVVGIVDHQRAIASRAALQAPLDPGEGLQPLLHGRRRGARRQRRRRCGAGIARIVDAGYAEGEFERSPGGFQLQRPAQPAGHEPAMNVGRPVEAETDLAAIARQLAPDVRLRIVGVEDGDAARGQAGKDLTLGQCHILHRAEALEVRAQGIVHQRHGGCRQARQVVDLAAVAHAHLDHRRAMRVTQPEQRQRQADLVVEVAARGQHRLRIAAEVRAQDRGAHFLDRGLAVAAGDAEQRNRKAGTPGGGQLAQRQARVVHHDQRQSGIGRGPAAFDHGAGGALGQHLAHEVMTVEAIALECDEQHAGSHGARVGADGVEHDIRAEMWHAYHRARLRKTHHRRASSADFAVATSE
jgi:hypothetical protein